MRTEPAGLSMFFFFPFNVAEAAPTKDARESYVNSASKPLPLLPEPKSGFAKPAFTDNVFLTAIEKVSSLFVDVVRRTLTLYTSSLTALGNRANAFFAQAAAMMAFDRAARSMAAFGSNFWPNPAFGATQGSSAWPMSFFGPFTPQSNPWAINPWTAFADFGKLWAPFMQAMAPAKPAPVATPPKPAPFTTTFSLPGLTWGFSFEPVAFA